MLFSRLSSVAVSLVVLTATGAQAQASLDTPEGIVEAMEACAVIVAAHDYKAEGGDVNPGWDSITSRSASIGEQDDPVRVVANVFSNGNFSNSSCGFLFDDGALGQATFDLFMQDRDGVMDDDDTKGFCLGDEFLALSFEGPDGPISSAMKAQAYVEVYHGSLYGTDPCAS